MKIYDETTKEELTEKSCDLEKGYLYDGQMKTGYVEVTYKVMEDSVSDLWPEGMREEIPAHDTYEDCQYYHTYTEEELESRKQAEKERVAAEEREMNISRITEIDAQITYTAMMTNTLLNDESDASDNNDSSTENNTEIDTSTKEDTNNEQSNV